MTPKLIATDLDGTVLLPAPVGSDLPIVSEMTIDALRRAHATGIPVVAVTGRSHWFISQILEPIGIIDWAVCSNGSTTKDLVNDRVSARHVLGADVVERVASVAHDTLGTTAFGWEDDAGFVWDRGFRSLHPWVEQGARRFGDRLSPDPASVNKLFVAHTEVRGDDLVAALLAVLPDLAISTSGPDFVEITGAGVDKAFGLAAVCASLGVVAEDVVAFGDNLNDLPMLEWAGTAVAMGNAHTRVKQMADAVTESVFDDGVARYLDAHLP